MEDNGQQCRQVGDEKVLKKTYLKEARGRAGPAWGLAPREPQCASAAAVCPRAVHRGSREERGVGIEWGGGTKNIKRSPN